jgi:hypothetical protein
MRQKITLAGRNPGNVRLYDAMLGREGPAGSPVREDDDGSMAAFDGPKLKIRRARHHIEDARSQIGAFLARQPYRVQIETDPDPAYQRLTLQSLEPLPDEIPLVVGDAIHNLRSALDHLAGDLVRLNNKSDKKVSWPTSRDKASLQKRIKETKMNRASDDVLKMIRGLAPYPGGNDGLIALHDMDIVDKHQIIVPISQVPRNAFHTFISEGTTITFVFSTDYSTELLTAGDTLHKFLKIPQLKEGSERVASFDIAFADFTLFAGEPVSPWLGQVANYVEQVVETLEALCLRGERPKPPPPIQRRDNTSGLLKIS